MAEKALKDTPPQATSYVMDLPQPPLRNAEEYLRAYVGYIYTAVGAIAQEVASIDLHLYKVKFNRMGEPKTQEIYEHPALSVLNYVNDVSTLYDLLEATQTYLELTGEAFWVILKDGKNPREIWLVRPDWMKVIPSKTDVISHYTYHAGGVVSEKIDIPKENVIPFKYFNPLNPYRGKGATQAAALPFDILNFAQEYNRNFFFNSAIPSLVFSTDQKVSEQAVKRFLNQWQASFGGRAKSNKVAFLGSGLKMDKASFASKELDFNEQMKTMRDDVLAVFKVPKTILGLTDDVNRANATATTRAFMERVVTPRMTRLVSMLNEFYLPMFEGEEALFFDFTDPSPEDVELKLKRYESGRKYTWLTPNEIRVEENLEPLPGGDDLFTTSANSTPDTEEETEDEETTEDTDNPNEDTENEDELEKPTADDEPKGFRAMIARMLGYKVIGKSKVYEPPAYLKKRMEAKRQPKKHMMRIPVKKPKELEKEILAGQFVEPLKKFIAELLATDDYKPLAKSRPKKEKDKLEDLFLQALDNAKKGEVAKEQAEAEQGKESEEEVKHSDWTEEKKIEHWNKFVTKADKREKDVLTIAKDTFKDQEKIVIAKLEEEVKSFKIQKLGQKATAKGVLPTLAQLNALWNELKEELENIYTEQGEDTMDELGSDEPFKITTEFAKEYLDEYSGTLIKEIDSTTLDALRSTLAEGFDLGEGIQKLKKRVQAVFEIADSTRATMIARTEVIKASNSASVEAYRQSGVVKYKEWLTQRDGRACVFCLDLDGKAIKLNKNYFNQGDSYKVGDEVLTLDFVDVGEPPLHPRCRCTVIPVID